MPRGGSGAAGRLPEEVRQRLCRNSVTGWGVACIQAGPAHYRTRMGMRMKSGALVRFKGYVDGVTLNGRFGILMSEAYSPDWWTILEDGTLVDWPASQLEVIQEKSDACDQR